MRWLHFCYDNGRSKGQHFPPLLNTLAKERKAA